MISLWRLWFALARYQLLDKNQLPKLGCKELVLGVTVSQVGPSSGGKRSEEKKIRVDTPEP